MSIDAAPSVNGSGPEKRYFDRLQSGEFEIQRCQACGRHVFYPRVACPLCGSRNLNWVRPSGRGIVYSTTVVRRALEDGGDYNVSLIDLEEGPRMMSRVLGVAADRVRIGTAVTARIEAEGDRMMVVWDVARPETG